MLFQGDSITDAGRAKDRYYPNQTAGMGNGYAILAAGALMLQQAENELKVYNRGISGNKVYQLAERWDDDCLNLKPDVLSILIGVNDFWHKLNGQYSGTVEVYEKDLRALLERTRKALPNVKIIIGEPFAVKGGTAINERWYPEFPDYQVAAARIAKAFQAAFIPYQQVFDRAITTGGAAYWCPDGVHPSLPGAQLMANAWMEAFDKLK